MSYVTLSQAGAYVATRKPFRGNNVYGTWEGDWYVVYSYGIHFPMYIFDCPSQQWLANSGRYSVTTSKHQGKCAPPRIDRYFDSSTMQRIAAIGLTKVMAHRVLTGEAA